MIRKIAILRGINVGGKRKILMQDLKTLFHGLGFGNIETYIQSGNVFFDSDEKQTDSEISDKIEQAIFVNYKFEVPVIISSALELEEAIKNNPFYNESNADINMLHLTFLKETPTPGNIRKTGVFNYEPDRFIIKGKHVFIYCEGKYHQTKLSNNFFEKKLETTATTRNWKTVLKLLELSKYQQ